MQAWIQDLSSVAPWLPAAGIFLSWLFLLATWGRPLRGSRWVIACAVLATPLTFPRPAVGTTVPWGEAATVLTTGVIILAARLPDWDGLTGRRSLTWADRFFWLLLPNLRIRRQSAVGLARLKLAGRYGLGALIKWGGWQVLNLLVEFLPHEALPWPVRSGLLMLFFVLNVTACHDAVAGFVVLAGYQVDEVFDAPLLSTSPRDFWSRRWNKFISRFALKHVALKTRRLHPAASLLVVFACSGLFHEYFAWGVGGAEAVHGSMLLFFTIQGVAVWLGSLWSPRLPAPFKNGLTFAWMVLTAPLFFVAIEPALRAFGYPGSWLPF